MSDIASQPRGLSALPALSREFYLQPTVQVARALLGRRLVHDSPLGRAAGLIVETEAYLVGDPGSHASRRRTVRNAPMFAEPGTVYVYRVYGLHCCLNLVSQPAEVPEAVLIRALEPVEGLEQMRSRRGVERIEDLCSGPGKLAQALGVTLEHNWGDATGPPVYVAEGPARRGRVAAGRRVGLSPGRGEQAHLRFALVESRFLSRKL